MRECDKRGKKCFLIVFPTPSAYDYFIDNEENIMSPLLNGLEAEHISHLDLTKYLAERLGQGGICETLTNPEECVGHFNAQGNKMIAEIVRDHISLNSLL